MAYRSGAQTYFDRAGLPEYELKPLDNEAADQLLAARFPGSLHNGEEPRLGCGPGQPAGPARAARSS